jgi:hypothetical protein
MSESRLVGSCRAVSGRDERAPSFSVARGNREQAFDAMRLVSRVENWRDVLEEDFGSHATAYD